jgi:transcriptional regulator with XRE-family HTH domain
MTIEEQQLQQAARLEKLIDALNLNGKSISKVIGVSQSLVSQLLRGKKSITTNLLNKITGSYPAVNANWILYGQGEMFFPKKKEINIVEEFLPVYEQSRSRTLKELEDDLDRHENMFEEMARQMREMKNEIEKLKS